MFECIVNAVFCMNMRLARARPGGHVTYIAYVEANVEWSSDTAGFNCVDYGYALKLLPLDPVDAYKLPLMGNS